MCVNFVKIYFINFHEKIFKNLCALLYKQFLVYFSISQMPLLLLKTQIFYERKLAPSETFNIKLYKILPIFFSISVERKKVKIAKYKKVLHHHLQWVLSEVQNSIKILFVHYENSFTSAYFCSQSRSRLSRFILCIFTRTSSYQFILFRREKSCRKQQQIPTLCVTYSFRDGIIELSSNEIFLLIT